ncbi:unnamed protein product, partial [Musa acuminata subsp. malaccensis]
DSSSNVRIEDCYIVSGDDCIAIKSGWDEYGIAFNMSSKHIVIRRLTCISPTSAVIALGSEMSGGIQDVRAEDITAIHSESGVRIKTTIGRGAYVKDIFVRRMNLHTMKWVFWMTGTYGQHPDDKFDPKAIPVVQNISYSNVVAENVTMAREAGGDSRRALHRNMHLQCDGGGGEVEEADLELHRRGGRIESRDAHSLC